MQRPHENGRLLATGWLLHFAGLCTTVAATHLASSLLITPVHARHDECLMELMQVHQATRNAAQLNEKLSVVRQAVADARKNASQLEQRIPSQRDELRFLNDFTVAAERTQVEIENIEPQAATVGTSFSRLPFRVRAQTSFRSLCELLQSLSQFSRMATVAELEVEGSGGNRYALEMTVEIYAREPTAAFRERPWRYE